MAEQATLLHKVSGRRQGVLDFTIAGQGSGSDDIQIRGIPLSFTVTSIRWQGIGGLGSSTVVAPSFGIVSGFAPDSVTELARYAASAAGNVATPWGTIRTEGQPELWLRLGLDGAPEDAEVRIVMSWVEGVQS